MNTSLADRIKKRIQVLKLTQEVVAERASVSQSLIYKLVSGKVKNTSRIVDLAHALECDIQWLAVDSSEESACDLHENMKITRLKEQIRILPKPKVKTLIIELLEEF